MPVTVEALHDGGVVLHYSGVLTAVEIIRAKRSLVSEQNRGLHYLIVDASAADEFHISTDELRVIAKENKRLAAIATSGMPVAIAAPQDLGFGLARMWKVFAAETGWRISVFRSRAEAESWIQGRLHRVA